MYDDGQRVGPLPVVHLRYKRGVHVWEFVVPPEPERISGLHVEKLPAYTVLMGSGRSTQPGPSHYWGA